jgi:hypothetical protein
VLGVEDGRAAGELTGVGGDVVGHHDPRVGEAQAGEARVGEHVQRLVGDAEGEAGARGACRRGRA